MTTNADPLLSAVDVHKHFGGVRALNGASLSVPAGLVYGLIGPNGSGKTTLFNVMTGFLKADSGAVTFAGERIDGLAPFAVARRGLCRTFQSTLSPSRMTVMENMLLAAPRQLGETLGNLVLRRGAVLAQERARLAEARRILETVKLADKADHLAGELSGGQKKLLALGQALMAAPHLILLDEPVAGVNPLLVNEIVQVIRDLCAAGRNFLIVEHNMGFVRSTCDRVAVLDAGRVIAEGMPADVLGRDDVLRAYLGRRSGDGAAALP